MINDSPKDMAISRNISREERFFEIIESMPRLQLRFREWRGKNGSGVPDIKVWAWNTGGVVLYKYYHSGLSGMESLRKRLLEKEAKEFKD